MNNVFGCGVTYLGVWMIAVQARILGGLWTLYSWSEEQPIHPFEHHAEEVLNSSWSFWVELPHPEGSMFAWQDPSN